MRSYIEIDKNQLLKNYKTIKEFTNKEIISVIKSNAYGHGLIEIASILKDVCSCFMVATLDEAIKLRNHGIKSKIICLEKNINISIAYKNNISIVCFSIDDFYKMMNSKLNLKIHLKIETGLNRLGLNQNDLKIITNLAFKSNLIIEGIYTHIADYSTYNNQVKLFKKYLSLFSKYKIEMIHICSSRFIDKKENLSNYTRVGLCLYGYSNIINVKPILTLKSPIYRIIKIKKGQRVGYHKQEIISSNGYLLTIPLGYADGWISSRKTIVSSTNKIIQVGETCMDHLMLFSKERINVKELEIISPNIDVSTQYHESIYQILSLLSTRLARIIK